MPARSNGASVRTGPRDTRLRWPGRNHLGFGAGGDSVRFIALPVVRPGHAAELRLGFDERPARDAGADAILAKPFDVADILSAVGYLEPPR